MRSKKLRHGKIVGIIGERAVTSQEELLSHLSESGIRVTQATLSRDIRELNLVKIRGVYRRSGDWNGPSDQAALARALKQYVLQSETSGNMLMIRTAPGNAHAVGVVLDSARWPEVLGTVAGDDTVFALLKNPRVARRVMKRIEEHLS